MMNINSVLLQTTTPSATGGGIIQAFNQVFPPGPLTDLLIIIAVVVIALYVIDEAAQLGLFRKWLGSAFGVKKNIADDSVEPLNLPASSTFTNLKTQRTYIITRAWETGDDEFGTWECGFEFDNGSHITGVKSYQLNIPASVSLVRGDVIPFEYDPDGFGNKLGRQLGNIIQENSRLLLENAGIKSKMFKMSYAHDEVEAQQREHKGKLYREPTPTGKRQFERKLKDAVEGKTGSTEVSSTTYNSAEEDFATGGV
jgi:hypothetical protein